MRVNITYPAVPDRQQGFQCPFNECRKEHSLADCGVDVILNKTLTRLQEEVERSKQEAKESEWRTRITIQDPWEVAGISSLRPQEPGSHTFHGGRLIATWIMAEQGKLKFEAEVTYEDIGSAVVDDDSPKLDALRKTQELARTEMDCLVCYALFCDPLTAGCGHTFCRSCLHRILDHSPHCPVCRRRLALNPLLNRAACPSNERLDRIIETFWIDELRTRREAIAAERHGQFEGFDIALFVLTLAFPMMPTFLHIFEPRYRLMIRRAMDGNRTFGMVLPKRARSANEPNFYELGTLLRIVNVQYYPDGRSLIETIGISRFRVLRHGTVDGYAMCDIERVDDISLEDEEAVEAQEATTPSPDVEGSESSESDKPSETSTRSVFKPKSLAEIETMTTASLMEFALDFVSRMTTESVPWLAERMLSIYGECPEDPAIFPWWFASMLPVRELEKYRLLGTSSVRDRLKICCSWIVEWESSHW